ncbi:MAG: [citrate (pro-3S)-lyase] ligase [Lachnotalea sp.]
MDYGSSNDLEEEFGGPFTTNKLEKLRQFLSKQNLKYDDGIQYTCNLIDENYSIVGTGSLDHNVLKCIAIDGKYQGQGLLSRIMTHLLVKAYQQDHKHLFLYTKPNNSKMFSDFGFYEVAKTEDVLLMENYKNGITDYVKEVREQTVNKFGIDKQKVQGAIIMNCNPFTLGHQYLIEKSASMCDILHIFVVSNDVSMFSQKARYKLVWEGTKDLKNVILHETKDYLISPATFPTYFIKDAAREEEINCRLDIEIFKRYIIDQLGIKMRFVGTEPNCRITDFYNQQLIKYINQFGVVLVEIERKKMNDIAISASLVRKLMEEKKFEQIKDLVPPSTYQYITQEFYSATN